ncbi:rootletin [Gouania willdenowi]|uniref:rootletin n=1 Tax=Gouania willdenowi TaxID=441366 RepID=UPI001055CA19|nr:rootletin-like [Gouania willdenowi]
MSHQAEDGAPSPGLEAVIQKLEESLLYSDDSSGERSLTFKSEGEESGATATSIPTRIRQIITRNLAEPPAGERPEVREQPESQALKGQMERDQLSVKQRLDQLLMIPSAGDSDLDNGTVTQQNKDTVYRHKLQAYQEAQQRQAQLVQRLQTKVLQYKRRCGELEEQVLEKTSDSEKMRLLLHGHLDSSERQQQTEQDLNTLIQDKCVQLEEERRRCANLSQLNSVLREQLDQAGTVNKGLSESLWRAREEVEFSKREQETCASRWSREQTRVRELWRQAASLRTTFTQLRTFTDRTLSEMRGECIAAGHKLSSACLNLETRLTQESTCSGVEIPALERQLKDKLKDTMKLQARWDAEKIELNTRILELTDTLQHLRSQNSEKESSLSTMQACLSRMETRRAEDKEEMKTLTSEIQDLQKTLRQVHLLVGGEEEHCASDRMSSPKAFGHSPLRTATLMAVQNTLSRHQKQTQELRACLDATLEQGDTLRDHLKDKDAERRKLEQKIQDGRRGIQEVKKALEESLRESNRYRCSVELISSEKAGLEKLVSGLQQEAEAQRAELEAVRGSSQELQRQRDLLRQQREDLETQLAQQRTEAHRGEKNLQELEGMLSDLRRELVTVKEALSQITLQKEVLEDDKNSLALALSKMESQNAAQEFALTKLQSQEATLKDSLDKMAALSEGLAKDKVELSCILLHTEAEKTELGERRREADQERVVCREEAARAQKELMDVLGEKHTLESSLRHTQDLCLKLKAELQLLHREREHALETHSQVKKQSQTMMEELCACQKKLEEQSAAVQRAAHDQELLTKDKAALHVRLTRAERQACVVTQELLTLRAEKESLETSVMESQELVSSLESQRGQWEEERLGLLLANKALTRDAAQLRVQAERQLTQATLERSKLEEKLSQAEDAMLTSNNREALHGEQLEAHRQQHEQQCAELRVQVEKVEEQLQRCEELRLQSGKELQQLQEEMSRMQQEHSHNLLQAESDKQQALSQMELEKVSLAEKISSLREDLAASDMEMERLKREALSKQEQDKNAMAVLQAELQHIQAQFEESLNSQQNMEKSLTQQVRELNQQREHDQQELVGLRQQVQCTEDSRVKGQQELIKTCKELQVCAHERDKLRKEALDLNRRLSNETKEREAIHASNQELRALIKRAECDNSSLRRAVEEKEQKLSVLEECQSSTQQEVNALRSSMREQEKSRLRARRELQELRRRVKVLEAENIQQKQELQELQACLSQEEQKEEAARHTAFSLKQRVLECEAGRQAALSELTSLQSHMMDLEIKERQNQELLHEKDLFLQLNEQKNRENTALLERDIDNSRTQVKELTVQAGLAENRTKALQEQLHVSSAKCKDLQEQLRQLYSAVRCTIVWRGNRKEKDMNVESVKTTLQEFQQNLRNAQKERDEAKAQIITLSQHTTDLKGSLEKSAAQQLHLQKSLMKMEKGKQDMEEQLHKTQASLSQQEETSQSAGREKQALVEEITHLKTKLHAAQKESRSLQDKLEVVQGLESSANSEQRKLRESAEAAESRVKRLELSHCTLQGELQRAQLRTTELEAESGALQEKLTDMRRKQRESEDRCSALRLSEEKLRSSLAQAEQHVSQLREQLHRLSTTVSDTETKSGALQEHVTHLQRALTSSEHDRRLLQERLDQTREALSESKILNHSLQRAHEDTELKYSDLEKHNRTLKDSLKQQHEANLQSSQQQLREKEEVQEKMASLQISMHKLQSERVEMEKVLTSLSRDKASLRKTLEKVELERMRKEEEIACVVRARDQLEQSVQCQEQALAEKQDVLRNLQAQISELEHAHSQRLLEVTARHHQELDLETGRLRDSQNQAEHALESREKAHRQRVRGLEEQVSLLQEQLEQETKRRQAYFSKMLQPGV